MVDNSNGWHFKHGLDADFMEKLKLLAEQGGWFADVLADPTLILGIRKNYLNVYWLGQSLFKIERSGKTLKFSTHPKYLLDPDLSKAVSFNGSVFKLGGNDALTTAYGPKTLAAMKRAAKLYSGDEKIGVHAVVCANEDVIDTEVAFSREGEADKRPFVPRIDLVSLEELKGSIRLRFWEAKLYANGDIRANGHGEARVVGQVMGYQKLVEEHRAEVLESYQVVARNLRDIGRWGGPKKRKVGRLIERVANGEPVDIDKPPMVGLIVYGYDDDQGKSERWKNHFKKLTKEAHVLVRCKGDPQDFKLRGDNSVVRI